MSTLKVDNLLLQDNTKGTGRILETVGGVCNGQSITTLSGTYSLENVTAVQALTTTHTDVAGSTISYTPPEGTKSVSYECTFVLARTSTDANPLGHFSFFIDSDEVVYARTNLGSYGHYGAILAFKWIIDCNASAADANVGSLTSWTTAKTLKMTVREYGSSNEGQIHQIYYWDGVSNSPQFHPPVLTITAIG